MTGSNLSNGFKDAKEALIVPLHINGRNITSSKASLIPVYSAVLKKSVHFAQSATSEDAKSAVEAAASAFKSWQLISYFERRELLYRAADNLERRADQLAMYQVLETSCTETWANFNVKLACRCLREIAASITAASTGEIPPSESQGALSIVLKEPVGPVLAIAPWNGSVILSVRALCAPLAAGCTVVFKASELCPQVHHLVANAFIEAGLPAGCLNKIQTQREDAAEVTEAIIAHPAIRKVEFVGSATVGRVIGQMASRYLKPVLMELGGKCPAIVLADADLESAAMLSARGAFMHHGQICVSTERIIVVREVADAFIEQLRKAVSSFAGDAGSGITLQIAQKARAIVTNSIDQGAKFLIGKNQQTGSTEAALEPTIITDVKPGHQLHELETFGPSASLYIVDNEDEAIRLANDTPYGLNAAIHTRDPMRGLRLAKHIDCGLININSVTMYDTPCVPVGGMKGSGWGRNNGKYALREFLVEKTVVLHDPKALFSFGEKEQ